MYKLTPLKSSEILTNLTAEEISEKFNVSVNAILRASKSKCCKVIKLGKQFYMIEAIVKEGEE